MSIRYTQSSLNKLQNDNVLKFLFDITFQDLYEIELYVSNTIYNKDEKVYIQENGVHHVYQCIVDSSSSTFIDVEWEHILDIYKGELSNVCNLKIREEVHIITEETKNSITTKLDFIQGHSNVIIYCGKKRYSINYDFTLNEKVIEFNEPFNVGDRLILEVREIIGTPNRLVLKSTNGINYEICVINEDYYICESLEKHFKTEVYLKDIVTGMNYRIFMEDEDIYYENIDMNVPETEITVLDENEDKYKIEMINDEIIISKVE